MSMIRGRIYNRTKKAAAFEAGKSGNPTGKAKEEQGSQNEYPAQKTIEKLASSFGVSASTVQRDGQFAQAVDKLEAAIPGATKLVTSGNAPSKQTVIAAVAAEALPMFEEEAKARQVKAGEKGKEGGRGNKKEGNPMVQNAPKGFEPKAEEGRARVQAATATGAGQRATASMISIKAKAPDVFQALYILIGGPLCHESSQLH